MVQIWNISRLHARRFGVVMFLALSVMALLVRCSSASLSENGLLTLTNATFDETLKAHERLLVEFRDAKCSVCEEVEPTMAAGGAEIAKAGLALRIAKVDVSEWPQVRR